MAIVLNNLTAEELLQQQENKKPQMRPCEYCGQLHLMKEGQRFCSSKHRAANAKKNGQEEFLQMQLEIIRLRELVVSLGGKP